MGLASSLDTFGRTAPNVARILVIIPTEQNRSLHHSQLITLGYIICVMSLHFNGRESTVNRIINGIIYPG